MRSMRKSDGKNSRRRVFNLIGRVVFLPALLMSGLQSTNAGSATWNLSPTNGLWLTAANWTPATVPNGPSDVATFNGSNVTTLFIFPLGSDFQVELNAIEFQPGASSFSFIVDSGLFLLIDGAGIKNDSTAVESFNSGVESPIIFSNSATAGRNTLFTNAGGASEQFGGVTSFSDSASAGSATFNNQPALEDGNSGQTKFFGSSNARHGTFNNLGSTRAGASGAATVFLGTSNAADGTFNNQNATVSGGEGGMTLFEGVLGVPTAGHGIFHNYGAAVAGAIGEGSVLFINGTATAGNGTFVSDGGLVSGAPGGLVSVTGSSTGGDARFINHGAAAAGAGGGLVIFSGTSTAGNGYFVNEDGAVSGAAGGVTSFLEDSAGGTARIKVVGTGTLDLSAHNAPGVTVGSIEGTGLVLLGANNLTVGANNTTTVFSGVISDDELAGSLTKLGTGTLVLAGSNTYAGGTTVEQGAVLVSGRQGSATGSGAILVNAGELSGNGAVDGGVTVGTGSGSGAVLSPGNTVKPGALRIGGSLNFKGDGSYAFKLDSNDSEAAEVVANGVTINAGAQFTFTDLGSGTLASGSVFIVIQNSARTAIAGTFANLPDNSLLTAGSNTYLLSYEGATGNDLTLTVQ